MSENTLMERNAAGLNVALAWLPGTQIVALTVAYGDSQMAVTVAHEKAMDAFHHPFCYLAPAQIEALNVR